LTNAPSSGDDSPWIIIMSDVYDHATRLRSFELIADLAGIGAPPQAFLAIANQPRDAVWV
jgi:hypothetical protein